MQAVRFYSHLEILINTPTVGEGLLTTDELCCVFMSKATRFHSAGQKGLQLTFPLLLWIFGPAALVLATLAWLLTARALDWDDSGHRLALTSRGRRANAPGHVRLEEVPIQAAEPDVRADAVNERSVGESADRIAAQHAVADGRPDPEGGTHGHAWTMHNHEPSL